LVYQTVTAQKQPALAFASSGALNYVFEKGKTYAVGAHIQGSAAVAYYTNAAQASFFTAATSYVTGSNDTPAISITPFSTSTRANVRLTTVLAP
ncbi:MAG TPA: hypothetical protein VNW92_11390, partial [Polyangiaceae bacterium]|nr:hypothetical protein [Polyangiaceae bacterium]